MFCYRRLHTYPAIPGPPAEQTVNDGNGLKFKGVNFNNVHEGVNFSLGSFSTTTAPRSSSTYSESFDLLVTYSAPASAGSDLFSLDVLGSITVHEDEANAKYTISLDTPTTELFGNHNQYALTISLPGCEGHSSCVVTEDEDALKINGVITAAVPEPSTWAMMILGFLGLGFATFRGKKASAPRTV
jgi:hypothetical protein